MIDSLIRKAFLVDLAEGLGVTFRSQNPKKICTEQYPAERPKIAERYRGAPSLRRNPETGETKCNACGACALACPENLIVVTSRRNEQTKKKELIEFLFDTSRCMFCGLCEEACPSEALDLTPGFEIATYSREGQIWTRAELEHGFEATEYKW
jgi:NADH-quinone oxidoreductase subunit I